ncbi:type II toxin-antitoxin system prevent-host-death family antitoxin [Ectothiorhodospira haloalkaliphila]|uniref:type II toxin-antitoxin system Phd/YefM family antitoxin n=1 Tax=Ectothiorhodospira haloalkaliphila TaxID=421628 RepID=UPI001EE80682|nr:type II toxin-antitoxin system prevent-host-death family antitoxin [Ectothiorhodospira haloalkaliphila]MCG5524355.1 type II toxin-antitoxin system prevent-host-death family antitoxin [Ectothiorhodospira haloalkaliphila]
MSQKETVGAYQAKTNLPAYLRRVQAGGRLTITQRGKPVAQLVPYVDPEVSSAQAAAGRMRAFMRKRGPVTRVDIKALIEEGRD